MISKEILYFILSLGFFVLNILLAGKDAARIKANKPIDHTFNALMYLGCCALCYLLFYPFSYIKYLEFLLTAFIMRKVVFDISLNVRRGLSWDYISKTTTSKIDQVENQVFSYNGRFKYVVYSFLLAGSVVLYFLVDKI